MISIYFIYASITLNFANFANVIFPLSSQIDLVHLQIRRNSRPVSYLGHKLD